MTIRLHTDRPGFAIRVAFLIFGASLVAGCGGHHGSSSNNNTSLTAIIHWPALSVSTKQAGITGISTAAKVCIITTTSGNTGNGDPIDFTPIIRNPAQATTATATFTPAYTDAFDQAWNSNMASTNPQQVRAGQTNIQIRFYAQLPTGTTANVANDLIPASYALLPSVGDSAIIPADITGSTFDLGTLTVGQNPTGVIPITGTIRSVLIAQQTVNYGSTVVIPVIAYDATGTAVASPLQTGAAFFNETPGSNPSIAQNGTVTPNGLGSVTTFATVDGIQSNTVTITSQVGDTSGFKSQGGIQYIDAAYSTVATGAVPSANGDTISITYTGYYSNDPNSVSDGPYTAFDTANQSTPLTVTAGGNVPVPGVGQGLIGMAIGDQRMIIVPPAAATGAVNVSANTTLIYIVTRTN